MPTSFARNLKALLDTIDASRADVATALGVDPSVVRRWALGSTAPRGANMARLTAFAAGRLPGFSAADWSLDGPAFDARRAALRVAADGPMADTLPGPAFRAFAAGRRNLAREAPIYEGFWMAYGSASLGGAAIVARATRIWRDGHRMRILLVGGDFDTEGEVIFAGPRIYCLTDSARAPGLGFHVLNPSPRATPDMLVGVTTFVALDPEQSPTAAPLAIVFERRFAGDGDIDAPAWRALVDRAARIRQPDGATLVPERVLRALDYRIEGPRGRAGGEPVLRVPASLAGE